MNNNHIIKEAEKLYNPKTAFGNKDLISLLKKIKVPNSKGFFEVCGDKIVKRTGVEWECASCGYWNKDKKPYGNDDIETKCKLCGAKHSVELIN